MAEETPNGLYASPVAGVDAMDVFTGVEEIVLTEFIVKLLVDVCASVIARPSFGTSPAKRGRSSGHRQYTSCTSTQA